MTGPMLAWLAGHEPEALAPGGGGAAAQGRAAGRAAAGRAMRGHRPQRRLGDPAVGRRRRRWSRRRRRRGRHRSGAAAGGAGPRPRSRGRRGSPFGEVPVVVGGADTPLALLAAGTAPALQVNLGTGAQLLRPGRAARPGRRPGRAHCYADAADGWYAMAALQNGGLGVGVGARRARAGLGGVRRRGRVRAGRRRGSGVPPVPHRRARRGGRPGRPRRLDGLSAGTTRADLARAARRGRGLRGRAPRSTCSASRDGEPVVLTGGARGRGVVAAAAGRRAGPAGAARSACAAPPPSGRRCSPAAGWAGRRCRSARRSRCWSRATGPAAAEAASARGLSRPDRAERSGSCHR